jgi:hypothetical protein
VRIFLLQPQALFCPLTVYINKVLLKYWHNCLLVIIPSGAIMLYNRGECLWHIVYGLQCLKHLLSGHIQKKKKKDVLIPEVSQHAAMLSLHYNTCSGNVLFCEMHEKIMQFMLVYIYFFLMLENYFIFLTFQ